VSQDPRAVGRPSPDPAAVHPPSPDPVAVGRPSAEPGALERVGLDRIELRGLRVFGYHGVLDAERRDGQEFHIDAVLWVNTAPAAATDDLSLTVNYAALADRLAAVAGGPPVRLIETLAQRLADAAAAEPLAREVEITVHKPQAPVGHPFADVSVTIRRSRR
jgi:dihydroneopterin aldolase